MRTRLNNGYMKTIGIIIILVLTISFVSALSISPLGSHTISENQTITLNIQTTNNSGNVTYEMNPEKGTLTKINNNEAEFEWTPDFSEAGDYEIEFTATDDLETKNETATITVTNSNDAVNIIYKTDISSTYKSKIDIELQTDKSATCKYSLSNKVYSNMEYTFVHENAEKTLHKGTTPTLSDGNIIIYMLCKDEYGDVMTNPETIAFTVNKKPSASISLSPSPPLQTERVTVRLTTSEELIDTPQLSYYFDDDLSQKPITLVGSGTSWQGYIIIRSTERQRIGTFVFKGTDLTNIEGTEITSGKIFIVDDESPNAVQSIEAKNRDDSIRIEWTYKDDDQDKIEEYNIYKRTGSGGTDYVDYYETTDDNYFIDFDVDYNKAYYYKVAAVDEAGNEGPLSKEVFVTHTPILDEKENEEEQNDNINLGKLDDKLLYQLQLENELVEKTLLDIEESSRSIGRILGKDEVDAIASLKIVEKIKSQETVVKNLQTGLLNLENYDLSETEFKTRSTAILEQVMEAWRETPIGIEIKESSTYQELSDDQQTEEITRLLANIYSSDATESEIKALINKNKELQDKVVVESKVSKVEIKYPESEKTTILVKKTINSDEPIENIELVEVIPDIISQDSEEITFSSNSNVIEKNKIISWTVDRLTNQVTSYTAYIDANLAEAKLTKTIVTSKDYPEKEASENSLTGNVGNVPEKSGPSVFIIPIIVGLMIAAILTFYYFYSSEEQNTDRKGKVERGISSLKSKFRKPSRILAPKDDSHKKINIDYYEEKEASVPKHELSKQIQEKLDEIKHDLRHEKEEVIVANHATAANKISEKINPSIEEAEEKIVEMEDLCENLYNYSEKAGRNKELDIDQLKYLQSQTTKMRNLLDEIESKNIEAYTEKAKKTLAESLKYMLHQENKAKEELKTRNKILDKPVPEHKCFVLHNGVKLRTLHELLNYLDHINTSLFHEHVNENKNDFANWVRDVLNENEVAHKIRSKKTIEELKSFLKAL